MRKDSKCLRIGAGAAACAVVAGALFYMSFLRGKTANASPAPELLSALPAGAPTLIYVDLAAVRASSFYQHRPDRGPIAMPNRDYAEFVQSTGFDFEKDLDRVAVASWPTPSDKVQRQNVLIAEGRFDRAKIREYALRHGKLDHQEGREVFLFPGDDRTTWNSVTFLDDRRIAMVAGPSISPLVSGGDDPATDPARERAARLDGAAAFAITRVPPIPDNIGPGGAQSTQLANLVRSVRWVTLAARPEGDDLRVSLEGECDTGEDARQLQSTLEVLRMFGRAALDSPKTKQSMDPRAYSVLQTLLTNADVTESGERVRVLIELTPEIFQLSGPSLPSAQNQAYPRP
jgi:hypothetical protein